VQREETGRRSDQPILPTFFVRMKITIATGPIFPVPAVRGGAVQRLWDGLAHEFVKRGHELTIFAREFPGQAKEETVDGIRYVRRGGYAQSTSIKRDLVQCLIYALKTARHVPQGDVVVTNDFWMPAVLPWLKPSAGKVVPCLQRFPKKQCGLYQRCAALAAVSKAVADAVRAQSPSVADKVVVMPNAVDEVFLRGSREHGARGVEQEGGGKVTEVEGRPVRILYVGRIHPEKGLGLLAQALRLLADRDQGPKDQKTKRLSGTAADWECVLVGPVAEAEGGGGETFLARIRELTRDLPVTIEAPIYGLDKLAAFYGTGDILLYPSLAELGEAMPLAPLEGMARGLVPVVSDIAAFREYLEPEVNGIVFDHRNGKGPHNLARALGDLIADFDKRTRLGAAARATAEKFSPAAIADKYLQLFEKVVSGR
jgi:glycosyltransferase involved in cell wall biosynthesis